MQTISSHYLLKHFNSLIALGLDEAPLLACIPEGREALTDPLKRFACEVIVGMLNKAEQMTGDASIGFRCGLNAREESYMDYASAMRCCGNIREIYSITHKFSKLTHELGYFTNEVVGNESRIEWVTQDRDPEEWRLATDLAMASVVKIGLFVKMIHLIDVFCVEVRHTNKSYHKIYENAFGCTVTYGAPRDYVATDKTFLDHALPTHNPTLLKMLVADMEQRLENFDQPSSIDVQVRQILEGLLGVEDPTIKNVLKRINMIERTLRRQLKAKGTSFSQILTEVRVKRYRILQGEGRHSDLQISQQLGYAEQSAFVRARKKWNLGD